MVNLISTNGLLTRKTFLGLFCNVPETQRHAQMLAESVGHEGELEWRELPEGSVMFRAFSERGTLLPARVLRANYHERCLVILDYDY